MPRICKPEGQKGSLRWIQRLVNKYPEILNGRIKKKLALSADEEIIWYSPKKADDYAEYRDKSFINLLQINLGNVLLEDFWPPRGPQWDALGKSTGGKIFLVEAKAHIPEIISPGTKAKGKSLHQIQANLEKAKSYLRSNAEADWSTLFYQYTNRLAHLYLLRELNNLPAYLVFIYFVNDIEMDGPKSGAEWKGALKLLHTYLGINRHKLSKYVLELFIDVNCLKEINV
jgi:hypothetical protein